MSNRIAGRRRLPMFASLALTGLLGGACADRATEPAPTPAPSMQVTSRSSDDSWAQRIIGNTANGAQYALFVPRTWNGGVVYYAHGFVDAQLPVALPAGDYLDRLRDNIGSRGFAFAYSSYRENGFAVKDGIQRTHQLRGLFAEGTGLEPTRAFLIGQSLGGAIALAIAEDKAPQYDGVMPVCGMVGGSLLQTQYLGNVRTLFDALFPGVLPGTTISMPGNVDVNAQVVGPAQANVLTQAGISKLVAMAMSPQTPLPADNPQNIPLVFQSLATALSFHARGINDILDRTNGATPFGNEGLTYTSPLWSPAVQDQVNATIARYTIAMSARNYLEKNWTPTGMLRIPTLTLHNRFDPVVPLFHEAALEAAATGAGRAGMLVRQLAATPYGHCAFSADEVAAAFDKLVVWVNTGVKP